PVADLSRFEGAGVYYSATHLEAQFCANENVAVVGGGNSAGQAALFLSQTARQVYLIIRSDNLEQSMSQYLIRRIEANSKMLLHARTEIVGLGGTDDLENIECRNSETGKSETFKVTSLFSMIGADPNSEWLEGCLALDKKSFVKTGPDLTRQDLRKWR